MLTHILSGFPWFWPGVLASLLVATAAARRLGPSLGAGPWLAWLLLMSLGGIAALTLTPGAEAFVEPHARTCDLSLAGSLTLENLRTINETTLNVALFVPLGLTIALLGRSGARTALACGALGLPVAIEGFQWLVPILDRQCQAGDVTSNLAGLVIGFGGGAGLSALLGARRG